MSREQQPNPTPTETVKEINRTDIGIGIGTAIGLVLAAIPIIEKLDQHANDVEILLGRLAAGFVISLGGAGTILLSNNIRNRQ